MTITNLEKRADLLREMVFQAYESQVGYGRWLLASLITIHGGSLVIIAQSGKLAPSLLRACAPLLIIGLITAIVTGAIAWINFTVAASAYSNMWISVQDGNPQLAPRRTLYVIYGTLWSAMLCALTSIICFGVASYHAILVINHQETLFEKLTAFLP